MTIERATNNMRRSADDDCSDIERAAKRLRRNETLPTPESHNPVLSRPRDDSTADRSANNLISREDSMAPGPLNNDPTQESSEHELWFCGSARPPPGDLEHCAVLTRYSKPSDPPSILPRIKDVEGKIWACLYTDPQTDLEVIKQYLQSLEPQILVLWNTKARGWFVVQLTKEQMWEIYYQSWCEDIYGYGGENASL